MITPVEALIVALETVSEDQVPPETVEANVVVPLVSQTF